MISLSSLFESTTPSINGVVLTVHHLESLTPCSMTLMVAVLGSETLQVVDIVSNGSNIDCGWSTEPEGRLYRVLWLRCCLYLVSRLRGSSVLCTTSSTNLESVIAFYDPRDKWPRHCRYRILWSCSLGPRFCDREVFAIESPELSTLVPVMQSSLVSCPTSPEAHHIS